MAALISVGLTLNPEFIKLKYELCFFIFLPIFLSQP